MFTLKTPIQKLTFSAVLAAAYTGLTVAFAPISYGSVQFRVSEALTILPFFFPAAIPGLAAGCFLSNLFSGYGALDLVFGPLATLLAAWLTSKCRLKPLAIVPPVVINALVIGAVIAYSEAPRAFWAAYWPNVLSVGAGQAVVLTALGLPLLYALPKAYRRLSKKRLTVPTE
jgi:uncharacterized membrane protein